MFLYSQVIRHHNNLHNCLLPTVMTEEYKQSHYSHLYGLICRESPVSVNILFLHNFPYYLEKIRPVFNVLDNDFILNNGHIHEGRP